MSELENCPKCSSELPPRFATGRVVCKNCGWTDQPKSNSVQSSTQGKVQALVPKLAILSSLTEFIKTQNGERVLIAAGTFIITSIFWLGISSLNAKKTDLSSVSPQPGSTVTNSASPSGAEQIKSQITNSYSIKGNFKLVDSNLIGNADNCGGAGGYSDVNEGMPVTVKDGTGKIIATGNIGSGSKPKDGSMYSEVMCNFEITVNNVPKADFYSILVGRRGELNYSFDEMQKRNWTISLSLS